MSDSITEYVCKTDGFYRRQVNECKLEGLDREVLSQLSAETSYPVRALASTTLPGFGTTNASIKRNDVVLTTSILELSLRSGLGLVEDGGEVFTPQFFEGGTIVEFKWRPPDGMGLFFVSQIVGLNTQVSWLVAVDYESRKYRLPLPNVFDKCDICTGVYAKSGNSILGCLRASLDQFAKSEWNADLMNDDKETRCRRLFRFKALPDGFEQLPMEGEWAQHCYKIANTILDERMVI